MKGLDMLHGKRNESDVPLESVSEQPAQEMPLAMRVLMKQFGVSPEQIGAYMKGLQESISTELRLLHAKIDAIDAKFNATIALLGRKADTPPEELAREGVCDHCGEIVPLTEIETHKCAIQARHLNGEL
jgi:hypothetical protein